MTVIYISDKMRTKLPPMIKREIEPEKTTKQVSILSEENFVKKMELFPDVHSSFSIKEFLECKLNGFVGKMIKIENSDLYKTVISEVEKALFDIILKETEGNQIRAAKILGINRNTLNKKIKKYKLINS